MIHIKQDLTQLVKPSQGRVRLVFWFYGNLEETGTKYPRSWAGKNEK